MRVPAAVPPASGGGREAHADIDTFRSDADGKIVEHQDALQVTPPTSENDNTMI
ncbi:hypothetical protein ABZT27_14500 [Streptomyces sp. NPDC005389]|uniref:hypothetical protein n=1 Tax=Streptomyces sp. NPDC005389 TaxID=3157040 RepID=UPI0033B47A68